MLRTMTVAALALTLFANVARADEPPMAVGQTPSAPIQTSIARIRFDRADHAPLVAGRYAKPNRTAQKIAAGAALGFVGMLAGAWVGASLEGHSCHCDDPGLTGSLIGAPIGAIAGAITGVLLASR